MSFPSHSRAEPSRKSARLSLRLYVAGTLPRAEAAKANLRRFGASLGANAPMIEIVDVFLEPERCLADGIIVTPTLVRLSPKPMLKILGTLADFARVRLALGIDAAIEPAGSAALPTE